MQHQFDSRGVAPADRFGAALSPDLNNTFTEHHAG
jgi:hypothetical protein